MYRISAEPIDVETLVRAVRTDACGGIVTFAGVVRERSDDDRAVTGLSYEAHESMALEEFARIADEARERFGACEIAIAHRTGDLRIGEVAVAVVVASAHRAAAFDACEYVIDELKARAPIWKKEHYAGGGDSVWKQNECNARPASASVPARPPSAKPPGPPTP